MHSSCEMEDFVQTHLCKLCVILRSRVLLGVSSLRIQVGDTPWNYSSVAYILVYHRDAQALLHCRTGQQRRNREVTLGWIFFLQRGCAPHHRKPSVHRPPTFLSFCKPHPDFLLLLIVFLAYQVPLWAILSPRQARVSLRACFI